MGLNRINADSIADGTVIASDIELATNASPNGAYNQANAAFIVANSSFIQANAAFTTANSAASTGKAIAMSIVFG